MTAQEARELTTKARKSIEEIEDGIKIMAKAGHDFCAYELNKVREPEEYKKHLEELGFKVDTNNSSFNISW